MASQEVSGDLLCLILDLNPVAWAASSVAAPGTDDSLALKDALDHILVLCNAHLSLRHENEIAVFAAGPGQSRQLFSSHLFHSSSSTASTSSSSTNHDSNIYQQFRIVDDQLARGVKEMMADFPEEADGGVNLVGALSMALCHINRLSSTSDLSFGSTSSAATGPARKAKPRIVVLSVTPDASGQYVPIMNCIFTAQKSNIQIDVLKVYGSDAVFLQQACHLTSGAYYRLSRRAGLLQYLLMGFLPAPSAARNLNLPSQQAVDLRAACFCHRKIVDIGYVCSVCLSIFCGPLPVCSTCRTKFPMSTLKRLGFGARPPGAGAPGAGMARPKKRKVPPTAAAGDGARPSPGPVGGTASGGGTPAP